MCLKIDNTVHNTRRKENGYCVAYKNVTKKIIHGREENLSPFNNKHKYNIGVNIANVGSALLTEEEVSTCCIDHGFHLFLDYKVAKRIAKEYNNKTIKVYYKPEDVRAYGIWEDRPIRNVVVTKLLVKSLKGI